MDKQGFRVMLEGRKVPPDKMDSALALAERFEQVAQNSSSGFSTETAWAFSRKAHRRGTEHRGELHYARTIWIVHQK